MKRMFGVLVALVASSALASFALAAPLSHPGISVSGSGSHFFKVCSTCPDDGAFDSDNDGGDFVGSAETTGAADNFYSWLAQGTLVGPNALPVLKARAEAMNPSANDPNFLGIGSTSATASAQGLQEYHYAGTEDGTYTLTFHVDGTISGDNESITAGLSVFSSNYDPFLEGEFQITRIASGFLSSTATMANGQFSGSQDVTFAIPAGEDFFVLAFLSGNAFYSDNGTGGGSLAGVADASHTFTADFSAGDVSLLTPVPEPSLLALTLAGLGMLGCALRRSQ